MRHDVGNATSFQEIERNIMQDYTEYLDEVLISKEDLQNRIAELGKQISQDYHDKKILMICILRGGVMFLSDLIRHISIPVAIEFMAVSS
jgi:hypoxanthine phosphoribosyltransferase